MKIKKPKIGSVCPAMINENYGYHLSGDAGKFCTCSLTNKRCIGIVVADPDDQSSQFFSRGRCIVDKHEIKKCPLYGVVSKELIVSILKDKAKLVLEEKIKEINNGTEIN